MESDRFDAFVRALGSDLTRRRVVAGWLGAGATGVLALAQLEDTEARRKKRRRKKNKGQQNVPPPPLSPAPPPPLPLICAAGTKPCGAVCIPQATCCGTCLSGQACCNGVCSSQVVNGFCICRGPATCPDGCVCALRAEDPESACAAPDLGPDACAVDTDCDPGTFCRQTAGGGFCSLPCVPE